MLIKDHWWVVVPMKDTRLAKSRLGGEPGERRQLAITMARDTLSAIAEADRVEGVIVVCDREDDVASYQVPHVTVVVAADAGLNDAVRAGAAAVRAADVTRNVAAMPGDLPYLHPDELDVALAKAGVTQRACVADRSGLGTTLLTAPRGLPLDPAFGPDSRNAHRASGAVELVVPAWSGLRRDVDLPSDLTSDVALGSRTREVLSSRRPVGAVLARGA